MRGASSISPEVCEEIVRLLKENKQAILMDLQGDFCNCNNGKPKLVYKSPAAYKIGKLLEML